MMRLLQWTGSGQPTTSKTGDHIDLKTDNEENRSVVWTQPFITICSGTSGIPMSTNTDAIIRKKAMNHRSTPNESLQCEIGMREKALLVTPVRGISISRDTVPSRVTRERYLSALSPWLKCKQIGYTINRNVEFYLSVWDSAETNVSSLLRMVIPISFIVFAREVYLPTSEYQILDGSIECWMLHTHFLAQVVWKLPSS